ncbi:MAG: recombination protein RecR [Neisseriaceae bacterium]|nr:recombination protein RecR [Neisseriaceae bacterium]
MTKSNDALSNLITALKALPNVGTKSAQRIAYHLLQHNRQGAERIVATLSDALAKVRHCRLCNTFCEDELCGICADEKRDTTRLMIVEMPVDIASMEDAHCHDGLYFVLMGQIDPTQGKDLEHIELEKLVQRIADNAIDEVIIATNFTAQGNATAYVLYEVLKQYSCKISRLSHGMPLGGEIEYIDAGTLSQAVYERKRLKE